MILLKRSYPIRAKKAKMLLSRTTPDHPKGKLIEELFRREDAGYWGEKNLDYYLSFLPDDDYLILQHIRLKYNKWTFQIDFLLLTTKFALIIEAKNYKANLYFESQFNQLIQTQNDKEKVYDDPLAQVQMQQLLLSKWLKKHTLTVLPIHTLVVMSNPNAILKTDPENKEILKKVCKPYKLLDKIREIQRIQTKVLVTEKDLRKTGNLLKRNHQPEQFNILEYFKMTISEVLTGVLCEKCGRLPMEYQKQKWYCRPCDTYSNTAHIEGLEHYFHLIKDTITNSEYRNFLHVPTVGIAQKQLQKLNLPSTGNTKARIYHRKERT